MDDFSRDDFLGKLVGHEFSVDNRWSLLRSSTPCVSSKHYARRTDQIMHN
uniref:Uncharacterized protein n=1 Tax=Romanomermis culicivorax TaxID=13658 RepID=A0A915IJB3_ROMCU